MQVSFSGFSDQLIQFYRDLKANNNRQWFETNKKRFKTEVEPQGKAFAEEMCVLLSQWLNREVEYKIFRIYRDVRFSKDKTPYNAYLRIAFYLSFHGEGCGPAFYFSLDDTELVAGAGQFQFEKASLLNYRERLADHGGQLDHILSELKAAGYRLHEPHLKRIPKGVDSESPISHLYRYKGLAVWQDQPVNKATASSVCLDLLATYEDFRPLIDWLEFI